MSVVIIDKPKVSVEADILLEIQNQIHEVGQVVLHFLFESGSEDALIRIWQTSYLYDQHSDHVSDLVHAENITYFPIWTICNANNKHYFTLIFSGLPRNCLIFDFKEDCGGKFGAFQLKSILRNKSDVYYLKIE